MAYLKTLGVIATMALGAAGFVACSGGKTEQQAATNPQEVKKDTVPKQVKKDSVTVMPPLTMIDVGDTLVFNSKQDSIDYVKYNGIAFDNYMRTYSEAREKSDSLLNAERANTEKIEEEESKVRSPQRDMLIEKRQKKEKDLEEQYKNGEISFKQLEEAKQKAKDDFNNEMFKLYEKYHKGTDAERKTDLLEKLEDRRIENVRSEAYTKYLQDRDEMRKKYCKEVRQYKDKPASVQVNLANNLTIDGVKVKWKSEADSIAANKYLNDIFEKEEKLNAKVDEQIRQIEGQIHELEIQLEQLEYDAAVLYEKGNKNAAMNKQAQIEKIEAKIEQLDLKSCELEEKYQIVEWDVDTINKYSVQQFDKDFKEMKQNRIVK